MSRIVSTTIGSLGDLHLSLASQRVVGLRPVEATGEGAIAIELRQRGHNIVFATHKEYQMFIFPIVGRFDG